ncbi:MAG: radical SAM protein [Candidatus Omnitrophica bacterium]|nr:radical SAM protein [Candidatus Omnitrophota bacterium]
MEIKIKMKMNLEDKILTIMEKGATQKIITGLLNASLKNKITRKALINAIERATYRMSLKTYQRPKKVLEERYYMGSALLHSIERLFDTDSISPNCVKALSNIFLGKVFLQGIYTRRVFEEKNGFRPPCFVTISPTNVCNLKCIGCYAGEIYNKQILKFEIFDRVISEIKEQLGAYFFVISGGEPFVYNDNGKTLFDILEKHNDCYFMSYTNGTMIKKDVAKRLAELGNLTPAISVEGFETQTDGRRGNGVFKRIMEVMDDLREEGVPFGISVTPTRYNAEFLLSDEFIDFYFEKKGAFYGWYFQYMPIGRGPSVDLMVTPGQRYRMLKRIWQIVIEKKIFIADFWNSGTASDGCMAGARGGGYFYIMWDGTIAPCVFIPFKDKNLGNIYEIYESGKTITDAIKSPLFEKIREWQNNYWIKRNKNECGNLLVPCIIRDNSIDFYKIVKEVDAIPIDEGAKEYLRFIEEEKIPQYNKKWRELVDPLWQNEYLNE